MHCGIAVARRTFLLDGMQVAAPLYITRILLLLEHGGCLRRAIGLRLELRKRDSNTADSNSAG